MIDHLLLSTTHLGVADISLQHLWTTSEHKNCSRKPFKMSVPLRSKQGCWTCRLRRKKCDERRDVCFTCESLSITCYGYGSKPDWMDGGEKERSMATSIKQIVKHTSRKKGRLGTTFAKFRESTGTQGNGGIALAPKTNLPVTENSSATGSLDATGSETSPVSRPSQSILP